MSWTSIYDVTEEDEQELTFDPVHKRYVVCTVHASPDCLDQNGITFDGQSETPRVECSACYKVISS